MNDNIKQTVLFVDDELNILNALKRLLRKEKYQILTAQSGLEGLEILSRQKVHLVISDQRMPEMNGNEFLARVKQVYPETMRIILTGYTDVHSITESINQGHVYKFFIKPWNDQKLKEEIYLALRDYDKIFTDKSTSLNTNGISDLQFSLKTQAKILGNLPIPVIATDHDHIIYMNKTAFEQFPDINHSQPSEKKLIQFLPGDIVNHIEQTIDAQRYQIVNEVRIGNFTYDIHILKPADLDIRQFNIITFLNQMPIEEP